MKNHTTINKFIRAFLKEYGLYDTEYTLSGITGDGSTRFFQRLEIKDNTESYIFMKNPPHSEFFRKENFAYLKIGNHMIAKGLPLPRILKHDLNNGYFILEDMGDRTLQDEVIGSRERIKIYENVIDILLRLQVDGKDGFDTSWCCQTPYYDSSLMREKEAWYFRDAFLRDYAKVEIDFVTLNKTFEHIISKAEKAGKNFLLHRDFQSRNIMFRSKELAILDWQGARLGPLAYDLASLIFDPYVDLTEKEKRHLIEVYETLLKLKKPDECDLFKKYFFYIAVMRLLQALGAYSFLSLKQGKTYFNKYIPAALNSLKTILDELSDQHLLPLMHIVKELGR